MWQTYSVLSKNKKPRISQEEFLNYYHIGDAEIQDCELQEFLEFFEVSKEDLYMRSKEEVFFALQGFRMDREAEMAPCEEKNLLAVDDINEVEFKCVSGGKEMRGRIDFVNERLELDSRSHSFSHSDKPILTQALRDIGLTSGMPNEQERETDEIWEFEVKCMNEMKRLVRAPIVHPKLFLQVLEAIMVYGN